MVHLNYCDLLIVGQQSRQNQPSKSSQAKFPLANETSDSSLQNHAMDGDGPSQNQCDNETQPYVIEEYPGAAATHEQVLFFMDNFDSNKYADCCMELPYYPFSSREEWELMSFLLHPDLSMAAINKFLKLAMVTHPMFPITYLAEFLLFP